MFEITPDDIANLNDKDLRSLVGLLCEAELRKRGLPAAAVTWGGDQDAADRGIDVRVSLAADTAIEGFIPRPVVGFQVKKPDLAPAAIGLEMRPGGLLRPSIRKLAEQSGATSSSVLARILPIPLSNIDARQCVGLWLASEAAKEFSSTFMIVPG